MKVKAEPRTPSSTQNGLKNPQPTLSAGGQPTGHNVPAQLFFGDRHAGALHVHSSGPILASSDPVTGAVCEDRRALDPSAMSAALRVGAAWKHPNATIFVCLGANDLSDEEGHATASEPRVVAAAVTGLCTVLHSLVQESRLVVIGVPFTKNPSSEIRTQILACNKHLRAAAARMGWLYVNPAHARGGISRESIFQADGVNLSEVYSQAIVSKAISLIMQVQSQTPASTSATQPKSAPVQTSEARSAKRRALAPATVVESVTISSKPLLSHEAVVSSSGTASDQCGVQVQSSEKKLTTSEHDGSDAERSTRQSSAGEEVCTGDNSNVPQGKSNGVSPGKENEPSVENSADTSGTSLKGSSLDKGSKQLVEACAAAGANEVPSGPAAKVAKSNCTAQDMEIDETWLSAGTSERTRKPASKKQQHKKQTKTLPGIKPLLQSEVKMPLLGKAMGWPGARPGLLPRPGSTGTHAHARPGGLLPLPPPWAAQVAEPPPDVWEQHWDPPRPTVHGGHHGPPHHYPWTNERL